MFKCICCEEEDVEEDGDECEYCSTAFGDNEDEEDECSMGKFNA
jgi:hypothetical protein